MGKAKSFLPQRTQRAQRRFIAFLRRTKMKFLRLPSCALVLWLASMAFSQSEVHKPDAQKPATRADQTAKEIILIGEVHGTKETPRLFSNLVTVAAGEKNKRIGVGLELPRLCCAFLRCAVQ